MQPARILIIEDNPLNMELAEDLLVDEGFEVLPAADAITGIEIARSERPDLILMDLQLPGIDGLQATQMLKADERTRTIPIVALTAHAMNHHDDQAKRAGCCDFISKPIDTDRFPDQVRRILKAAANEAIGELTPSEVA